MKESSIVGCGIICCYFFSSEKSEGTVVSNGAGIGPTEVGWAVACTTVEEWNEVIETLKASKHTETKRLFRALQGSIWYC